MNAEIREVFLEFRQFGIDAIADEKIMAFWGIYQILITEFFFDFLGDVNDILAMVIVIAKRDALAEKRVVAEGERMTEMLDLVAAVIDVELTGDIVARFGIEIRDGVAECRSAGVAKMQVARRVS